MDHVSLFLLRHGQTEENVRHILQGHMPGTLTPLGRQQAEDACGEIRELQVDIVLSSDLKRCTDTYDIIKHSIPELPDLITTPLLRERGWGSATGMVADGVTRIVIPDDAESVKALKARAQIFIDYLRSTYSGKKVLAISHGLFCRVIQAVLYGKEIADIKPMTNAEVREITI